MRIPLLWLLACAAAVPLRAQNIFVVVEDGVPRAVKAISDDHRPEIDDHGQLHKSQGLRYSLRKAVIYGLGVIDISAFKVEFTNSLSGVGTLQMHIYGRLKANTALRRCFMVMRFETESGKSVDFEPLPDLEANKEVVYDQVANLPLHQSPGSGHYDLMFFSDGLELLTSRMPPMYVAQQRQKTRDYFAQRAAAH
jgi:hypothetical protein